MTVASNASSLWHFAEDEKPQARRPPERKLMGIVVIICFIRPSERNYELALSTSFKRRIIPDGLLCQAHLSRRFRAEISETHDLTAWLQHERKMHGFAAPHGRLGS